MRTTRTCMVQNGPFKFYAKVTDSDGNSYYLKGTYGTSDEFKSAIRNWYASEIDAIDVYNLRFEKVTNVGRLEGLEESRFTEV